MSILRVAELAGVSYATVSRVINNRPGVADDTVAAVRKAIGELGYAPSAKRPGPKLGPRQTVRPGAAKRLSFLTVGVNSLQVAPALQGVIEGISMAAAQHRVDLSFGHIRDPNAPFESVIRERTEGLLLLGALPAPAMVAWMRRLPTVWVLGQQGRPEWGDQVMPHAYQVGSLAAKYLASRGHQSVAFLNWDSGHWVLRSYGDAFRAVAEEIGLRVHVVDYRRHWVNGQWAESGTELVEQILDRLEGCADRPTGLFIASDAQAAVLQPAMQRRGIQVGSGGVDVVSCNNDRPLLAGLHPTPAAIDINAVSIGRWGLELLLQRIARPDLPPRSTVLVEPHLVLPDGLSAT